MNALIKIYDYLCQHKPLLWLGLGVVMLGIILAAWSLRYNEDIFDFLPQDKEYTESMQVYSSLSEASRIVIIFEGQDPDSITLAIDALAQIAPQAITEVDVDGFIERLHFMHEHLPYFLSDDAYTKLEAVCDTSTDTLASLLYQDRQILSMPGTSFLQPSILSDPLGLIPFAKGAVGQYAGAQSTFTSYDGYMMTTDHHRGFAFYDSPYGSTETGHNASLVDSLCAHINTINQSFPSLHIRLLGAPVIAVNNARQIQKDSTWAILISIVLIFALLLYSFPRKRDILFIGLSVGFGWLVGMAALYVLVRSVSVIVLGIGAILIGICINYPLHLLIHQRYTTSVRQTLQEVLSPLLTGNITTVGAFLALIPLHSPALRQLGIFASAMLLGTILFCIFILPHLMDATPAVIREIRVPSLPHNKVISYMAVAIFFLLATCVALRDYPLFDSNISHINYLTPQQKKDFAWFENLSPHSNEPAYLSLTAKQELSHRINHWNQFWQTHDAELLRQRMQTEAVKQGFNTHTFDPFFAILSSPVQQVNLDDPQALASVWPGRLDTERINSCVAESLSDNFNYLGFVCSAIVLIFLCLSFKNIWMGLIAFVPMLLSWVLIIALMQLFGLQFNIVNVILATFIFGQGDDYTIFVVEGLQYELQTGKKMVKLYQQSILLSAIIMLLSIGVLVFAKHPAMHSLGAVTLIGMTCVVLMAFVLPPMLFKIYQSLKMKSKEYRHVP